MDFDDFFAANYRSMVRVAQVAGGVGVDGENLAQEAFVRALHRWDRVRRLDDPAGWVRRVCVNLAIDETRRRSRRGSVWWRSVAAADWRRGQRALSAEAVVDAAEGDAALWAAVGRLPPRQRAAVALYYLEELSTAEIADVLACRPSTVTTHLAKARANLARQLADEAADAPSDPDGHRRDDQAGNDLHKRLWSVAP